MPDIRALLPVLLMAGPRVDLGADQGADPLASPRLGHGVTSSFGGGTQASGNPDVGVATRIQ